jgi:uncharacterized protein (DUF4415 family)
MVAKPKSKIVTEEEFEPLTDADGEVRELTEADFARFRPSMEVIPHIVEAMEAMQKARGQRGPQKSETKDRVGLRLDHNVIEYFRSTGPGWQGRINDILADHVKKHS